MGWILSDRPKTVENIVKKANPHKPEGQIGLHVHVMCSRRGKRNAECLFFLCLSDVICFAASFLTEKNADAAYVEP